jgi:hypothetical protein
VNSFKRSDYSTLVRLFLKEPTKINYPREYGVAKKLLSTYSDFTFWKSTLLDPKRSILNSLAYFLTEDTAKRKQNRKRLVPENRS